MDAGTDGCDAAAVATPASALIGETVGSWRIERLLAEGGMGRVYLAVQPTMGGRVAIKVLTGDAADDPGLVERFFAEARAVNLIRHENIVDILDLARLPDGRPYIVMEYLSGASLATVLERRGPLPLASLARLMAEVLDALEAAHGKGVVHRDLKPDNIFVTPSGHAKVLDFGIAKLAPEAGAPVVKTAAGYLLGTPPYMSPEQAAELPVDARSDLYTVGIILFEAATGQRPFQASSTYDLLRQHIEVPPPSPRTLRPELPPALEAVILRALAKAPVWRYPSAAALRDALLASVAELPAEASQEIGLASSGMAIATPPPAAPEVEAPPEVATRALRPGGAPAPPPAPIEIAATEPRRRRRYWIASLIALVGLVVAITIVMTRGDGATTRPATAPGADAAPAADPIATLEAACRARSALPCHQLALLLAEGRGTRRDLGRAIELHELACHGGEPAACVAVGTLMLRELDEPDLKRRADPETAQARFRQACEGSEPSGCVELGRLLETGAAGPADAAAAYLAYRRGCELDLPAACFNEGVFLLNGRGVAREIARAATRFQLACEGELPRGCAALAQLYLEGKGVSRDVNRAETLYLQACQQGVAGACFSLASLYESGRTLTADPGRTDELYDRACELGEPAGCEALARLRGTP